jgi:hypothetical protein
MPRKRAINLRSTGNVAAWLRVRALGRVEMIT